MKINEIPLTELSNKSVAAIDIVTDLVNGTDRIAVFSVAILNENRVVSFVNRETCCGDIFNQSQELLDSIKEEVFNKSDLAQTKFELQYCAGELSTIYNGFFLLHACKPELVISYHSQFDLGALESRVPELGINMKDLWSDPSVLPEERQYEVQRGNFPPTPDNKRVYRRFLMFNAFRLKSSAKFEVLDGIRTYQRTLSIADMPPSFTLRKVLEVEGIKPPSLPESCERFSRKELVLKMQKDHPVETVLLSAVEATKICILFDKVLNK